MSLSKREKTLIFIFLFSLALYFLINSSITKQLFDLKSLREEYSIKNHAFETMHNNIITISDNEEKYLQLLEFVNNQSMLSGISQESIMVFLDKYLKANNIKASVASYNEAVSFVSLKKNSYSITKSTFESKIDEIERVENKQENNLNNVENNESSAKTNNDKISIRNITVALNFESSYKSIIDFINQMQSYPYEIVISNMDFSLSGDRVQGKMNIVFYDLPKLSSYVEKNKDWIWNDKFR